MSSPIYKPIRGAQLNAAHPLARGLKHAFLMNELGGSYVFDSIQKIPLKIVQGSGSSEIFWGPSGIEGRGLGGSDAAVIQEHSTLFSTPVYALTIVVVGLKVVRNDYTYGRVVCFQDLGNGHNFLFFLSGGTTDPNIRISSYVFNGASAWDDFQNTNAPGLLTTETNDFALVWKGGSPVKYYKNGQYISQAAGQVVGPLTPAADTYLSFLNNQNPTSSARPLEADIQAVFIYERDLSAQEIALLYADPYCMFSTRSSWDIGAFEYVDEGTGPKWNGITPAKWNGVDWSNLKWNGM